MRQGGRFLLCVVAAWLPTGANAQACKVHIWPTTRFNATTSSIFLRAPVGGTHEAPTAKDNLTEIMSPERQAEVYRSLDWGGLLASKNPVEIVIEPAMDAIALKVKQKGPRLVRAESDCHYEVIIQGIAYGEDPLWGKGLSTWLILRKYEGASETAQATGFIGGSQGVKQSLNKTAVSIEEAYSVMREALVTVLTERVPVIGRKKFG
ncbi:hypothetical protein HNP52_003506 [Sphingomonas kyeonggiensis]|uniref:DUF4410 domain-containing protein n=1 Tax=Sphingomonas kyeonggiensis TaxID=1268553 RepID=A0A7W7K3M2_9SPHN|nr:hypothetical protein [Sphingomonas kyeonggiensis]MBB4840414.1 hypothetical protein [Sphingomonas kyeonggiensis]